MKKIVYFCIVFTLIIGCARGQNMKDIKLLRDSLDNVVMNGTLRSDTTLLKKALEISDYLLTVDTTNVNKRHYYHQRSMVFASLGRMDEAMNNAECAVLTLPERNPLRLIFLSTKYLKQQDKDSANYYLEKTIAVCDSSLHAKYNEDMAINKIKAIYLRDGEKKAKAYLSELLKQHPNESPMLNALYEDWRKWVDTNEEELRMFDIKVER